MDINIKASKYQLTITPTEPLALPAYKGATFRGGFGYTFKRLLCAVKKSSCEDCLLVGKCIYAYIFETKPHEGSEIMRKYKTVPHPFVIEPPEGNERLYNPGEEIAFGLVLIGRATEYLSYFIYTFDELGKAGLGRGKAKYSLLKVSVDGEVVYDNIDKTIKRYNNGSITLPMHSDYDDSLPVERITLDFITPTRIKYNMALTPEIEFHILIRQLLRRISLLYYFHCGGDISKWDFKKIIGAAENVRVVERNIRWHDWERFSTRQKEKMKMGGVIGRMTFEGRIKPFMPLLRAGELLHIGKGTSFGLGKYEIRE